MAISGWFSVQPCCVAPVFHTTNIGIGNSEKKTPMTTSEQAKCTSLNYILVCNCYEEFFIFAWKLPTITSMYISTLYIPLNKHTYTWKTYAEEPERRENEKKMEISPEIIFISLVSLYQFYRNHSFLSCQKEKCQKNAFYDRLACSH